MGRRVSVDELADVINEGLQEYASLTADNVKSAVRKSAKAIKEQINSSAPVRTGRYAKAGRPRPRLKAAPCCSKPYTALTGTCWRTFWKKGTPSAAADGSGPSRTSRLRKKRASRCWKA